MIELSNGHAFYYMAASGALGFDGKGWWWERPLAWLGLLKPELFTCVSKTITLKPTKGNLRWYNPWQCVRFIGQGIVNAVGLSNPGFDWWCKKVGPFASASAIPLMVSLSGNPKELGVMAKALRDFDLVGVEVNVSCPNLNSDHPLDVKEILAGCEAVKRNSSLPIILKLSITHDIAPIKKDLQDIVEAFSINSVPWADIFPGLPSPLAHLGGGGVSGKIAQPLTWKFVEKLSRLSSIPVIGPSVWQFEDLQKVRNAGARAVSFGSIFLRYPWRPTLYVRRDRQLKQQRLQRHSV